MLRLCPKRFLWIHFRKALPCFPILICSQSVFSHRTGSLLLLLLLLPIFSRFIFNLVQWLISRRALFNKMRNVLSLNKVFMGEEGFKEAREGGEKRQLFSFKEEQQVSTNQKDFCSLRLKTLESPLQRGYHLRESPSSLLPTPHMLALGANEVYPCVGVAANSRTQAGHLMSLSAPHHTWRCVQSFLDELWKAGWGQTQLVHPA